MDIENYKEAIINADMAFTNENYESALNWYNKALAEAPTDEYALSKAGAALVSMSRFDESFDYFQRAVTAGPDNGDNLFNMANAYFFSGDINKAMEYYTAAEMKECSEDVKARIYYQMAMMCTIKEDYQAALVNYQKYEDSDPTGQASLDTDIIAEKVNIYVMLEDYENAAKYAVKWQSLAPSDIRAYMVYFNLLMAEEKYDRALEVLDNAEKYAVTDEAGTFAVQVSRANFYVAAAGSSVDTENDYTQKAYDLMSELIVSPNGAPEDKNELVLALAELCINMGKIDEAIDLMKMVTEKPAYAEGYTAPKTADAPIDPAEIDAQLSGEMSQMDSKLASGEISEDAGELAQVNYDENGQPVREYPEGMFDDMPKGVDLEKFGVPSAAEIDAAEAEARAAAAAEFRARVNFMLLSCYAYKEDYEKALEYSRMVRSDPDNIYYSFFGRYSEAFSIMQLAKRGQGFTQEDADRKYAEEIAFFRAEMLKANENAAYALLFRTRMYAEMGKYTKAEELADLMAEGDKAAVMEYIAQCRAENEKK